MRHSGWIDMFEKILKKNTFVYYVSFILIPIWIWHNQHTFLTGFTLCIEEVLIKYLCKVKHSGSHLQFQSRRRLRPDDPQEFKASLDKWDPVFFCFCFFCFNKSSSRVCYCKCVVHFTSIFKPLSAIFVLRREFPTLGNNIFILKLCLIEEFLCWAWSLKSVVFKLY